MSELLHTLDLPALDGANPLGFLAALGTLTALSETDPALKLGWHARARWMPFLASAKPLVESEILQRLASRLRGKSVEEKAEKKLAASLRRLKSASISPDDADDVAKSGLKAPKLTGNQLQTELERLVSPVERKFQRRRQIYLARLSRAVPSPELALDQLPGCTIDDFRKIARSLREETTLSSRTTLDLLAAFGTEASAASDERISPTFFCFITGSGHQRFLDTAHKLMVVSSEAKIREALFQPWAYIDEKFTMRWDPMDDRRYALMDRDPTASDNKSTTVWMANLLAYIALANFPCATASLEPANTCWRQTKEQKSFSWPIWRSPISRDAIRSILSNQAFAVRDNDSERKKFRAELRARGVATVYYARRIQVGNKAQYKINFSSASAA